MVDVCEAVWWMYVCEAVGWMYVKLCGGCMCSCVVDVEKETMIDCCRMKDTPFPGSFPFFYKITPTLLSPCSASRRPVSLSPPQPCNDTDLCYLHTYTYVCMYRVG